MLKNLEVLIIRNGIFNKETKEIKFVNKDEIESYLNNGWVLGIKENKRISKRQNRKISNGQMELFRRVQEEFPNCRIIMNDRKTIRNPETGKPLELDIYLPDQMIAFEYNGNYYHDKNNPVREKLKDKLCREKGIVLIDIWEDEVNEWYYGDLSFGDQMCLLQEHAF